MSYENARYRNFGNDEGDVLNFFDNQLRNLVQKNGGDNSFATYTEDFHDKTPKNLMVGEKTRMMLTHPNHTISQIEKGFIEMEVEFEVGFENVLKHEDFLVKKTGGGDAGGLPQPDTETSNFNNENDGISTYSFFPDWEQDETTESILNKNYMYFEDAGGNNIIFIGFKDAVEIISECRFYVDGKCINEYFQNEMIRESFAYNSIRSRDAKICCPKSHSLWENVSKMSPNVCGVYIPLNEFVSLDGNIKYKNIKMQIIIPFTDQLTLQAWRLYPNRILGEIEEEIITSLDGLVWCQLQPKIVSKIKKSQYYSNLIEWNFPYLPLSNCFSQINDYGKIVMEFHHAATFDDKGSLFINQELSSIVNNLVPFIVKINVADNRLILNNKFKPKINIARTHLSGFGVKPEVTEGLLNSLQQPIIIPSQELTRYIFEQKVTEKEINMRKFIPLRNATNITMMFPRNEYQCTCFKNIMYQNLQLQVDKRLYPHTALDNTYDGRFIQYQLQANELDGYEATKEYIDSISIPLNDLTIESQQRYKSNYTDNTSFGINFQLERGNAGYVFDGLDTGSRDVEIRFRAYPIVNDENSIENTYYYPFMFQDGMVIDYCHPPNPEMWICSDTYWTWSIENGVEYHHEGIPDGYE